MSYFLHFDSINGSPFVKLTRVSIQVQLPTHDLHTQVWTPKAYPWFTDTVNKDSPTTSRASRQSGPISGMKWTERLFVTKMWEAVKQHLPEVMSEHVAASTDRHRKKAQCQTVCLIWSLIHLKTWNRFMKTKEEKAAAFIHTWILVKTLSKQQISMTHLFCSCFQLLSINLFVLTVWLQLFIVNDQPWIPLRTLKPNCPAEVIQTFI